MSTISFSFLCLFSSFFLFLFFFSLSFFFFFFFVVVHFSSCSKRLWWAFVYIYTIFQITSSLNLYKYHESVYLCNINKNFRDTLQKCLENSFWVDNGKFHPLMNLAIVFCVDVRISLPVEVKHSVHWRHRWHCDFSKQKFPMWIVSVSRYRPCDIKVESIAHIFYFFLPGSGRIDTAVWMHYLDAN